MVMRMMIKFEKYLLSDRRSSGPLKLRIYVSAIPPLFILGTFDAYMCPGIPWILHLSADFICHVSKSKLLRSAARWQKAGSKCLSLRMGLAGIALSLFEAQHVCKWLLLGRRHKGR